MKRKVVVRLITFAFLALILAYGGRAYAGKSWSDQFFSKDTGIVILGYDDKFEKVYAINVPEMKVQWSVGMPKSRSVSIQQDNSVVYLVGAEDTGFRSNLKALDLQTGAVKWERRLKDHVLKSPVYKEDDALYMAMDQKYRDVHYLKFYAIDKATGKDKWKPFRVIGTFRDLIKKENGDFVLIYQPVINGKAQDSLVFTKIEKSSGEKAWEEKIEGSFVSTPQEKGGMLYFITQVIEEGNITRTFYTINADDGSVISSQAMPEGDKPLGKIQFYNDKPIILTEEGRLVCLNGGTSNPSQLIAWQMNLGATPYSKPVIEGDKIFISTVQIHKDETKTYKVMAVLAETGQEVWSYEVDGALETEFLMENNRLFMGFRKKKADKKDPSAFCVVALDVNNGQELWKIDDEGKLEGDLLVKDGTLYIRYLGKGKKDGKEFTGHLLDAVNAETGSVNWSYVSFSKIKTDLHIDEDSVDFGTGDGSVISVSLNDGKEIFSFYAGENNELDTELAQKGNLLGFATVKGKYFILDKQSGEKKKTIDLKPWFADWKIPILIGCLMLSAAISWYIYQARKGKDLFVRRIAGLTAIDEAVGRSTEMGKPVLYITGLADVDDIQTLASLSIMGHIAQKTAEYDTPLVVPCCRSVVMSTAQEVVKESYLKAGRPDTYRSENIHYLTDDQFGFVAGVDGIMVREKPAANFYMGKFYAESLILAETGHSTGAIQIAGTAEAAQLPFFVAACDYTLIGEELFAASAYLSKDPLQIGSLKGQDVAKAIILIAITAGCLFMTFGADWIKVLFMTR